MEKTLLAYGEESWSKLIEGLEAVSKIVTSTIGPNGDNVLIERRYKAPLVTNDGVTVARHIQLEDPIMNMGSNLILQAGLRTNYEAGDGTTTTIGLAYELLKESLKKLDKGANKREVIDSLIVAKNKYIDFINKHKKDANSDDIYNIARISSQEETIASLIKEAFDELGENVIVNITEGLSKDNALTINKGVAFEAGIINYLFAADQVKKESRFGEAMVFLLDDELTNKEQAMELLQTISDHKKPAVVIAPAFSDMALKLMLFNASKGAIQLAPIIPPGTKQEQIRLIADLEIILDAKDGHIPGATLAQCGVNVNTKQTIFKFNTEMPKAAQDEREHIKKKLSETKSEVEKRELTKRLSLYSLGYADINVGGDTEAEIEELKLRTEDAVLAVKATIKNGYVEGGGKLMREFGETAGINAFVEIAKMVEDNSREIKDDKVLDPAEVHIQSIRNAVSFVKTILTTNGAIYFKPNTNENNQG